MNNFPVVYTGNVQCERLNPPSNSFITYANDRGTIKTLLERYTSGTFAEIQCVNGTVIDGENFLTCMENTVWDFPIPKCIAANAEINSSEVDDEDSVQFTAIAEKLVMTTRTTEEDSSSFEQSLTDDDSVEERTFTTESVTDDKTKFTDNEPTILPDEKFWKNLRQYYYTGCKTTVTALCSLRTKNSTAYTDLGNFESPDSGEFQDMDTKLLELLERSTIILKDNKTVITYENVFEFILYAGVTNEEKEEIMSAENMLRLVFCFYLDALVLHSNIYNRSDGQGITEQIKTLLSKMIILVYKNYLTTISVHTLFISTKVGIERTTSSDDVSSTTESVILTPSTTISDNEVDEIQDKCDLLLLNMLSPNSIIKYILYNDEVLDIDIGKMRQESILVVNGARVIYSCGTGYVLNGVDNSLCNDGVWSEPLFSCECKCRFTKKTL